MEVRVERLSLCLDRLQAEAAESIQKLFVNQVEATQHVPVSRAFGAGVADRQIKRVEHSEHLANHFRRSELAVIAALALNTFLIIFEFRLPPQEPILKRITLFDQLLNFRFRVGW